MISKFFPDAYYKSVHHVDYNALSSEGITNLIFDIDNTLAPFDTPGPDQQCVQLLGRLSKQGFNVCLLSNNKATRVDTFNADLGLVCVSHAKKPGSRGLKQALALLGNAPPNKCALIGDQLFTDIWCARRNGLRAVLVLPIAQRDEFWVKLKRHAERPLLQLYKTKPK